MTAAWSTPARTCPQPSTRRSSTTRPGSVRRLATSAWGRPRPGSRRRSSSCSKACTWPSGSTRMPSAPARRTGHAADLPPEGPCSLVRRPGDHGDRSQRLGPLHPLALIPAAVLTGAPVHLVRSLLDLRVVDHRRVARLALLQRVEERLRFLLDVLRRVRGNVRDHLDLLRELDPAGREVLVVPGPGLAERLRRPGPVGGGGALLLAAGHARDRDRGDEDDRRGTAHVPIVTRAGGAIRVGVRRDGDTLGSWRVAVASSTPAGMEPRSASTSTPTPCSPRCRTTSCTTAI